MTYEGNISTEPYTEVTLQGSFTKRWIWHGSPTHK